MNSASFKSAVVTKASLGASSATKPLITSSYICNDSDSRSVEAMIAELEARLAVMTAKHSSATTSTVPAVVTGVYKDGICSMGQG